MKTKRSRPFKVVITEHDSWSGPEELGTRRFKTELEARTFCREYNSQNVAKEVPEYYTTAEYRGER